MIGLDDISNPLNFSHLILSFKDKAPSPKGYTVKNLKVLYLSSSSMVNKGAQGTKLANLQIPSTQSRIVDAPDLLNDYYLNILCWGDTNILGFF